MREKKRKKGSIGSKEDRRGRLGFFKKLGGAECKKGKAKFNFLTSNLPYLGKLLQKPKQTKSYLHNIIK